MTDDPHVTPLRTELTGMAKSQKTFYLNDDLTRLLDHISKRSGASFTRLVTAALLSYVFETPEGPADLWMQYAVSLDLGELSVGDIPKYRQEDHTCEALSRRSDREHEVTGQEDTAIAEHRRAWSRWKRITEADGDDPVEKIMRYWAGHVHYIMRDQE